MLPYTFNSNSWRFMMKGKLAILVVLWIGLMLVPTMVQADPNSTFTATHPTQYVNGTIIPATDVLDFTIKCSSTVSGPYLFSYDVASLESGTVIDVSSCVQGTPGTYYFVATALSSAFGTESSFSNEATRIYTKDNLGQVPLAPTFLIIS